MSRCTTVLLVTSLMLAGCSRQSRPRHQASATPPAGATNAASDYLVGEPISYENLSIFPVTTPQPRLEDRFTTLNEGLRDGTVEVFEVGSDGASEPDTEEHQLTLPSDAADNVEEDSDPFAPGPSSDGSRPGDCDDSNAAEPEAAADDEPLSNEEASEFLEQTMQELAQAEHLEEFVQGGPEVNRVMVINRSRKPLYLMPGEIIMGGDQDRCVAEEFVIAPGDKPVPVDVFCVEHGRWGGRASAETQMFFMNSMAVAEESVSFAQEVDVDGIADVANAGKFVASIGALNAKARLAVQASKDQSVVWDNVEAVNAHNGIVLESGAFTGNYTDEASLERLAPYHEALLDKVPQIENIVGVIVAVNGQAQTMDLFESTPLFRKLWPKLLKSYALDAANSDAGADAEARCTRDDAIAFLDESLNGDVEESEVLRGIATTRRATDQIVAFAAEAVTDAEGESSGAGYGGGGFGSVHTSAFSK